MQNLGRMMSLYYLYEDIERSRKLQVEMNLSENEAVEQTFGVSFEEMGAAIARRWELPTVLQNSLTPDSVKTPPKQAATAAMAWHQICALFCRRVTEILFRLPENRKKSELTNCINFFYKALRLNEKEVLELIDRGLNETDEILAEMAFPSNIEAARNLLRKGSERALDMLSSQDTLVKGSKDGQAPIESIKHIMRLMHNFCNFDSTLLCLPSGSFGLVAIAGVGRNAGLLTTKFKSSGIKQDIFRIIIERKIDMFIGDVNLPSYAKLIPGWYREVVGAKSFVMLSLVYEGKLLGIIYGDYSKPRASVPSGLTEGIILSWRTQLIQILKSAPKESRRITLSIS